MRHQSRQAQNGNGLPAFLSVPSSYGQEKFNALSEDINASIKEISSVSDVTSQLESIKGIILDDVTSLASISEETSATNEEVAASIEMIADNVKKVSDDTNIMNDLAGDLKEAVSYFK